MPSDLYKNNRFYMTVLECGSSFVRPSDSNPTFKNDKGQSTLGLQGRKVVPQGSDSVKACFLLVGILAVIVGVGLAVTGHFMHNDQMLAWGVFVSVVGGSCILAVFDCIRR